MESVRDTRVDAMREAMMRREMHGLSAKVTYPTDMALGCHVSPESGGRYKGVVDMMQRELTDDELFRVAYVPFAIAELAWDYAATVTDIAAVIKDSDTRRLGRAMRKLREEYNQHRFKFIPPEYREGERENSLLFEESIAKVMQLYTVNVKAEIQRLNPQLDASYTLLLVALWQFKLVAAALMRYCVIVRNEAEEIMRVGMGSLLPRTFFAAVELIDQFRGDTKMGEAFMGVYNANVAALTAKIRQQQMRKI
ncbi:MAG: hypothetical protein ACI30K_05035 [Muribaculaceae bacterium]